MHGSTCLHSREPTSSRRWRGSCWRTAAKPTLPFGALRATSRGWPAATTPERRLGGPRQAPRWRSGWSIRRPACSTTFVPLPPPDRHQRSDEVEIRVHAAGLNFIDAMRALGVYPGQVDGPVRVGIECAGIITAVGDDVDDLQVGDAVIALAMDGVGSFVTTPACLVAAKPPQLSFEAAAALPIAYLTAYYSLHEQARLRRGEHVLIHSGAGGVGLAAVQVARWLGATVYATAGTAEKREHLHALGVEHVFDSRSLAFADEVLAATGGKGVDVVLNSLTGEAIAKGLEVLRPSGRFVEIGKRDIYGHGSLRLWQLRHNASYMVVDLAQLVVDRPRLCGRPVAQGRDGRCAGRCGRRRRFARSRSPTPPLPSVAWPRANRSARSSCRWRPVQRLLCTQETFRSNATPRQPI